MENKKSNKGFIIIIILLIVIILGLGTYIVYDKFIANNEPKKTEEKDNTTTTVETKESFLEDESKPIVYNDSSYTYLNVPYVNLKTITGTSLNKEIKDFVKNYEDTKEAIENYKVDYKLYENGDIVSVIMTGTTPGSTKYYYAFNLNKKNGNLVKNSELIKMKNINESDLGNKLLEVYENQMNEPNYDLSMAKNTTVQSNDQISIYDANKDIFNNTKLDDFDMYLNGSNQLIVVVKTYLYAGPDSNLYKFNLDTKLYEK